MFCCTDTSHVTYPFTHGWTFGVHLLAIMNNAAEKIVCRRFWGDTRFSFPWGHAKGGIVGSSGDPVFNCWRNCRVVPMVLGLSFSLLASKLKRAESGLLLTVPSHLSLCLSAQRTEDAPVANAGVGGFGE